MHAIGPRHRADLAVYRRFVPLLKPSWLPLAVALAASACTPLLFAARIWLLKVLIDTVLRGQRPDLLVALAGGFIAIAVARSMLTYIEDKLSGAVGTRVVRDLRVAVYTHLQGLSLRYFHTQRLGDLLTRMSGDIAAIENLLVTGLTTLVSHLVTIVLFTSLLIVLDPGLVLVAAGVLPVLVVTTMIDARLGRRAQRGIRETTSELTSTAEEGLSAIALVKSFARADHESARFAAASQASAAARLRAVGIRAVFTPLTELAAPWAPPPWFTSVPARSWPAR
jgi:ATP-binding cassette subfamily B protein